MEPSKQISQPCHCVCYMMCQKLDVLIIECCEYCWMCIVNVMFLENSLWVVLYVVQPPDLANGLPCSNQLS